MPIFGKEVREKWPVDADYKTISVIVTGEPGRSVWRRFRFMRILIMLVVVAVLLYSGIKSANYTGDRAAAWQRDMSQVGPDFAMFLESMR